MLLLDTCGLLWLAADPSRLSDRARDLVRANPAALFISAITAFEIAVKFRKGKLRLALPPEAWIQRALDHHGIRELPISWQIAARSALLPPLHADPADRMIVATAEAHSLLILTPDPLIAAYPGARVAW